MVRPASLPLFPEELTPRRVEPLPAPTPKPRSSPKRLWLAAHFPRLSLETKRVPLTSSNPVGVVAGQGSRATIVDCSQGARRAGVHPGLALNAALVLAPTLQVIERDEELERAALIKLAEVGYRFTPTVSIEAPHTLLLEVEGSVHLFGGPHGIRIRARDEFQVTGFTATLAVAPTPLAALWLSHASQEISVTRFEELRSILGKLPVRTMTWEPAHQDAFVRLGIEELVDLFRLPREGLLRRFGPDFLDTLDRAIGDKPDPRIAWITPKRVNLSREMPGELIQIAHLTPYIENMVSELVKELRKHDAGIDRMKLLFKHFQQMPTAVTVGSAIPHRDEIRWNALIQNKLASQTLSAPVLDVQLRSGRFLRYTAQSQDLLGVNRVSNEGMSHLVDMLRSRLGRTSVYGVTITPDARPEEAWRSAEPGADAVGPRVIARRPMYLLPTPVGLNCTDSGPRFDGATLKLVEGPERIEGGWWDGEGWVRDYYEALSSRGERLWVFRENQTWFLHGLYS